MTDARVDMAKHTQVSVADAWDRLCHDLRREPTMHEVAGYIAHMRLLIADKLLSMAASDAELAKQAQARAPGAQGPGKRNA